MKLKTFSILLIIFCALLAVVMLSNQKKPTKQQAAEMGSRLFPDLEIGDIAAITIATSDESIGLKQTESGWVVLNRFDYPADFAKIAELVQNLGNAKIGRVFDSSSEVQTRLSLYPPDQPDIPASQKGTRIILADKGTRHLAELIVSKPGEDGAAAGPGTYYILRPSQNRVYLIDQNLQSIGKNPADWLNRNPIDLNPKEIWKVVCFDTRKKRSIYTLARPAPDRQPALSELPAGKIPVQSKIDQVFEALTSFTFEDVTGHSDKESDKHFNGTPRFDYYLYDGTVYHVFPAAVQKEEPQKHYLRVAVDYSKPPEDKTQGQKDNQARHEAEKLNQKLGPWTYVISKWVFDSFITDPGNFTEKETKK